LGHIRLAAIGPRTAEALAGYHLQADVTPPEDFRAEGLASELMRRAGGSRFLLARASRGRELLAEALTAAGGEVTQVVVYSSRDVQSPDPDVAAALAAGRIDWITVTSSAIARSLVRMFGENLRQAKLASISPVTSATLRELGLAPVVEATTYTMEGLKDALLQGCGK
jgi:uroporphyrinogen III methyltransferase/synthase